MPVDKRGIEQVIQVKFPAERKALMPVQIPAQGAVSRVPKVKRHEQAQGLAGEKFLIAARKVEEIARDEHKQRDMVVLVTEQSVEVEVIGRTDMPVDNHDDGEDVEHFERRVGGGRRRGGNGGRLRGGGAQAAAGGNRGRLRGGGAFCHRLTFCK